MASFSNFLNQGSNFLTGAVGSVANRLSQAGLPIGGIFNTNRQSSLQSNVGAPSATGDWAVKVTVSDSVFADLMSGSPVFPASFKKNKGIRFPVTPFINMSHSAAYDARSVVHNNYPYYAYQNSQVDQMTIAGSFPVANEKDGQNWLASLHFLRTVTKMYYGGGDANQGNPPPVCRLNGYGDLIYKDVPIIITNFTVELREQVDSLIIINNNKLRDVYGNLGFKAGFSKADEVLSTASKGIAEVITHHYTQNIDLKDAKTVLSNSGTAIMGAASSFGENRAYDAITKALDSPLLNDNKITGAKNVLLLIVSGNEEITIDEIAEINDYIQDQSGNVANIIMGVGEDLELEDSISVTVIATGFNADQQNEISNTEPEKIIHKLEEENVVCFLIGDRLPLFMTF